MNTRREAGFTLIEIMVVILIIGFIASLVTLSVTPTRSDGLQAQTEQFVTHARFVAEEAALTYEVIGLFMEPGEQLDSERWCYRWRRWRDQRWQSVSDFLPDQCLDRDTDIEMIVEGDLYEYDKNDTTPTPVLWFYPSGESSRLEIAFFERFDSEQIERVIVDMMGNVYWQELKEEAEANW